MKMSALKNYYTNLYISPTFEDVTKYAKDRKIDSISTVKESKRQLNQSQSVKLINKVKVKFQDSIYPSLQLSNIILKRNNNIYSRIQEAITNEKNSKIMQLEKSKNMIIQKLKNMPKISKCIKGSELYENKISRSKNKHKEGNQKVVLLSKLPLILNKKIESNLDLNYTIEEDKQISVHWKKIEVENFIPEVREGTNSIRSSNDFFK